jgi:paired amphipathic helix protein Sin3a
MHTQQIIDQNMLVDQVEPFIGGNWELFEWFKAYVGYDGRNRLTDNLPELLPKPDLVHCQTVKSSPSYRVLPIEVEYVTIKDLHFEICLKQFFFIFSSGIASLVLAVTTFVGKY